MFSRMGATSSVRQSPLSRGCVLFARTARRSVKAHVTTHVDRRAIAVAIISPDALLAALLGAAVELTGYRAAFPRANESEIDALRRIRPALALIDADHQVATDEALLGRALMTAVRVLFFGRAPRLDSLRTLATRYEAGVIVLPDDVSRLEQILATNHPLARPRSRIRS